MPENGSHVGYSLFPVFVLTLDLYRFWLEAYSSIISM